MAHGSRVSTHFESVYVPLFKFGLDHGLFEDSVNEKKKKLKDHFILILYSFSS